MKANSSGLRCVFTISHRGLNWSPSPPQGSAVCGLWNAALISHYCSYARFAREWSRPLDLFVVLSYTISRCSQLRWGKRREKQSCLLQSERCLKPQSAGSRLLCQGVRVRLRYWGARCFCEPEVLVRSERCKAWKEHSGFSWSNFTSHTSGFE